MRRDALLRVGGWAAVIAGALRVAAAFPSSLGSEVERQSLYFIIDLLLLIAIFAAYLQVHEVATCSIQVSRVPQVSPRGPSQVGYSRQGDARILSGAVDEIVISLANHLIVPTALGAADHPPNRAKVSMFATKIVPSFPGGSAGADPYESFGDVHPS